MPASEPGRIRFGGFELDPASGELRKGGVLIKLQPQPFKVLSLLLERPGEVVAREELRQQVWGNETFVDFEQGLNYCIKQIRQALGDEADSPKYVETLPRRGYRFIYPVEREGGPADDSDSEEVAPARTADFPAPRPLVLREVFFPRDGPAAPAEGTEPQSKGPVSVVRKGRSVEITVAARLLLVLLVMGSVGIVGWQQGWFRPATQSKDTLLVLPFQNLGGDQEDNPLRLGLTYEAIAQMGQLQPDRLGVIAFSTALTYDGTKKTVAQIGRELPGLDYVLEGTVQRSGDRVRINTTLIQVRDATVVASKHFERSSEDTLLIQSDVAQSVADSLAIRILPERRVVFAKAPTRNPEAASAYLMGRYLWQKRGPEALLKSIEYFERAAELDPNFAAAYAGLADAYGLLGATPYDVLPYSESLPKAKQAALKALALDDSLAEAHTSLAHVLMEHEWDLNAAEREYRRALELTPNSSTARQWYAIFLWYRGRFDRALEEIDLAQKLDPLSIPIRLTRGWHFYYLRQYDKAIAELKQAMEMEPRYFGSRFHLGMAYLHSGRHNEAFAELEKAVELGETAPVPRAALGYAYAVTGRQEEARRILKELEQLARKRYVPAVYFAAIYTGLGETDRALDWLERGFAQRSQPFNHVSLEPSFDPLRKEPRYVDLMRRGSTPR